MSEERTILGALEYFKGDEVCYSVLHYDTVVIGERFVIITRKGTTVAVVQIQDFISITPNNYILSLLEVGKLNEISEKYE